MTPAASPFWQNAFLVAVLVAFGWCVWNGWRLGIVRALWSILAMSVAGVAGVFVGTLVGGVALAVIPSFSAMVGVAAGALTALFAYLACSFVGGLLFKRTSQQPTATLRLGFGLGGAALGAVSGLFLFWAALLFVRGLGGLCEGTVAGQDDFYALPIPEPAARTLVRLKKSVEAGDTGRVLDSLDVMPEEFYRVIGKFGRLAADPEAVQRFADEPEIAQVLADTRFADLIRDPEVQEIVRSRHSEALLGNSKMLQAMKDPGLLAKLQKIDIEKALDRALSPPKPAATPAPTPTL